MISSVGTIVTTSASKKICREKEKEGKEQEREGTGEREKAKNGIILGIIVVVLS